MITDATLRSADKTIVIDAKYYSKTLQSRSDRDSIHSKNLYQMFAYVKNLEGRGGTDAAAEGLLIYPTVTADLSFSAVIQNHRIRAETVDLSQSWERINDRLLSFVGLSESRLAH